jgi:hypothetical protein
MNARPKPRRCIDCGHWSRTAVDTSRGIQCARGEGCREDVDPWSPLDDVSAKARAERHELDVAAGFGLGGNRR